MSDVPVHYAATIGKSPQEVYSFWRNWANLPRFSRFLKSVQELGPNRTRWTAEGPRGDVTWEAETIADEPGHRLAWRSLPGADVANSGEVDFVPAPGGRGTEVKVRMVYDQPGGAFGQFLAKMSGREPEQEVADAVRRFKAILECGEVPVVEGQPSNQMRKESMPGDVSKAVGLR